MASGDNTKTPKQADEADGFEEATVEHGHEAIPTDGEDPFTAGATIRMASPFATQLSPQAPAPVSAISAQGPNVLALDDGPSVDDDVDAQIDAALKSDVAQAAPPPVLSMEGPAETPVVSATELDRLREQTAAVRSTMARTAQVQAIEYPKDRTEAVPFDVMQRVVQERHASHLGTTPTPEAPHTELGTPEPRTAETAPLPDAKPMPARRYVMGEPTDFMMGGYHVHTRLGQGGMAVVFLARPPGGTKDVVLKRIRPALLVEEKYVKLFKREARIASRLIHNNIVRILDHAEEKGESFIVMEFLDGTDLRDIAERNWHAGGHLPLEVVVKAIADAARGLDHAHTKVNARGENEALVHRDVSPENLFLNKDGVTKVLDFGIAKEFDDDSNLTKTGEVKGKVPYMSPEQILGRPLDGRSDQWSLAITAYWLLTGTRPFDGASNFMSIKHIIEDAPKPLTLLNPFVPDAVEQVVLRGLHKEPAQRFARCSDMADALEALLGGRDVAAPATELLQKSAPLQTPEQEPFPKGPAARPLWRWD